MCVGVLRTAPKLEGAKKAHILTFVVRVPDADMVGLGFNPWVGHLGTWDFSQGRSQRNRTLAKSKDYPGTPLPISQRWLECVDDELSALAVKTLSLSEITSGVPEVGMLYILDILEQGIQRL